MKYKVCVCRLEEEKKKKKKDNEGKNEGKQASRKNWIHSFVRQKRAFLLLPSHALVSLCVCALHSLLDVNSWVDCLILIYIPHPSFWFCWKRARSERQKTHYSFERSFSSSSFLSIAALNGQLFLSIWIHQECTLKWDHVPPPFGLLLFYQQRLLWTNKKSTSFSTFL